MFFSLVYFQEIVQFTTWNHKSYRFNSILWKNNSVRVNACAERRKRISWWSTIESFVMCPSVTPCMASELYKIPFMNIAVRGGCVTSKQSSAELWYRLNLNYPKGRVLSFQQDYKNALLLISNGTSGNKLDFGIRKWCKKLQK